MTDAAAADHTSFDPASGAYGAGLATRTADGTVLDGDLHVKDGLVVRVEYIKGRSAVLEYIRATGQLTPAEVPALLAANVGGSAWELGKDSTEDNKFYHRLDDRAIAHWTKEGDGSLLIAVENVPALGGAVIR